MAFSYESSQKVFKKFDELFPGKKVVAFDQKYDMGCKSIYVYPEHSIGNRDIKQLLDLSTIIGKSVFIGQDKGKYFVCFF